MSCCRSREDPTFGSSNVLFLLIQTANHSDVYTPTAQAKQFNTLYGFVGRTRLDRPPSLVPFSWLMNSCLFGSNVTLSALMCVIVASSYLFMDPSTRPICPRRAQCVGCTARGLLLLHISFSPSASSSGRLLTFACDGRSHQITLY